LVVWEWPGFAGYSGKGDATLLNNPDVIVS